MNEHLNFSSQGPDSVHGVFNHDDHAETSASAQTEETTQSEERDEHREAEETRSGGATRPTSRRKRHSPHTCV